MPTLRFRPARAFATALLALCLVGPAAQAAPLPELAGRIDVAAPTGEARGTFLTVPLFDAALWTAGTRPFSWSEPFALSLTYRRGFSADTLVWASMMEMNRIRALDPATETAVEAKLSQCFRAVGANDRITALSETPDRTTFFLNGQRTCTLEAPGFRRNFFSIWLDPAARDPAGAARLRGES
jgi:hypothetical protein